MVNKILIITDNKLSSLNQSNALATELANKSKSKIKILYKKIKNSFFHKFPNFIIYLFLNFKFFFKKEIFDRKVKLIISCGRISAPYNLILKKIHKCPNIHILDPYFKYNSFSKIIIPEHDLNKVKPSTNLLISKGTLVDKSRFRNHKIDLSKLKKNLLKKKKILLLIGGDGRSSKITIKDLADIIKEMNKLCEKFQIIYCFSRRTSKQIQNFIKKESSDGCIFFPNQSFNPYWMLIKISDYLFVTDDSISMTSDALSTGKPTYIIPIKNKKKKIHKFQKKIRKEGLTRLYKNNLETWRYQRLDESKRLSKFVEKL